MSKYLGKVLREIGVGACIKSVRVLYVKSSDKFCFKICEDMNDCWNMNVDREFCLNVCKLKAVQEYQYKWSIGYKVREKKGPESIQEMIRDEYEFLNTTRKEAVISGKIGSDLEFEYLCVLQYKFGLSVSFLNEVLKQWKRKSWKRTEERWLKLEQKMF